MPFITDEEIDNILNNLGEFQPEPDWDKDDSFTLEYNPKKKYKGDFEIDKWKDDYFEEDNSNLVNNVYEKKKISAAEPRKPIKSSNTDFEKELYKSFNYKKPQVTSARDKELNTSLLATFKNDKFKAASVIRRLYAYGTDVSIVSLLLLVFVFISIYAFGKDSILFSKISTIDNMLIFGMSGIVLWVAALFVVMYLVYFLYFETLMGQTPGKFFMNIRIVSEDDEKPSVFVLLYRFLLFLILPLGILGLHNKLSGTRIVLRS